MELSITVQIKSKRQSGDIFGMFNNYKNVVEEIKSKEIIINVKDLPPNPPNSFNGAVGNFKLKAKTDKNSLNANEAINYEINELNAKYPNLIKPLFILFFNKKFAL